MIHCILLSAGLSSRFGSPKALAQIKEKTVIQHLQDLLISIPQIALTTIVCGASFEVIKPLLLKHKKVNVVYNKDYNFGQTSSVKAGLKNLPSNVKGVFLLPVDYPCVKKSTLQYLIETFNERKPKVIVPSYNNIKGHPPLLSSELVPEILSMENDVGLNTVIRKNLERTLYLPVEDTGVLKTFNTQKEFDQLKAQEKV